jgi:hypothetical protein
VLAGLITSVLTLGTTGYAELSVGPRLGLPFLYGGHVRYDFREPGQTGGFFGVRGVFEGYSNGGLGLFHVAIDGLYQTQRNPPALPTSATPEDENAAKSIFTRRTPQALYVGAGLSYMNPGIYGGLSSGNSAPQLMLTGIIGMEWTLSSQSSFAVEARPIGLAFTPANPNPPYSSGGTQFYLAPLALNLMWNFKL